MFNAGQDRAIPSTRPFVHFVPFPFAAFSGKLTANPIAPRCCGPHFQQENIMLEITDLAVTNVKDYLSQNNITNSAVRVSLMSGGCSGPSLSLSLDDAKDSDLSVAKDGISFVIDKGLSTTCGAVKVDFAESTGGCGCSGGGFTITCENPLPGARKGGCGGSCSSGCC
jgi:iron-sulfur cluster assembly protein